MATLEPSRVALSVQRAHLDLGRCDRATARGRLDRASSGPTTSDVRLASLTLRAALDRPETRGLEVADDAAWFRLDGRDTPVVQRLLRRLLHELAVARIESPGRALGVDDVCRAVWPGERILPRAARRRVQVAISTLRASGLRDVLHTSDQGYMLDPKVPVNIVGAMR
jgi:hypothetical protein